MKLTTINPKDVGIACSSISESKALTLLERKEPFILRLRPREFYKDVSAEDLKQAKRLKDMGIYECWEFYEPIVK